MNSKPTLPRLPAITTIVAAALSVLIGLGLLGAVTDMFERDGTPFQQLVAAERVCQSYSYVSEREACVRVYLVASRVRNVASR